MFKIPPLLLISFVENAFKYTSSMKGDNLLIQMDLILKNHTLEFNLVNQYSPKQSSKQAKSLKESGIGIKNTKKRLELLYPNGYSLKTEQLEDTFNVSLLIINNL